MRAHRWGKGLQSCRKSNTQGILKRTGCPRCHWKSSVVENVQRWGHHPVCGQGKHGIWWWKFHKRKNLCFSYKVLLAHRRFEASQGSIYDAHKRCGSSKHIDQASNSQDVRFTNTLGKRRRTKTRVLDAKESKVDALTAQWAEITWMTGKDARGPVISARVASNDLDQSSLGSMAQRLGSSVLECKHCSPGGHLEGDCRKKQRDEIKCSNCDEEETTSRTAGPNNGVRKVQILPIATMWTSCTK